MSDRRSYVALDWVNAQIAETFQQAQEALDGFIANPEDITKLRFGLTYIHQVSGSLVMLELHAAALLSKEIESLLSRVLEDRQTVTAQIDAVKLIKPILTELTGYLDKVAKTHEHNSKELLGLLNTVRDANQQEQFSEADIFNPDIAVARQTDKQQPGIAVEEFNELIRKLRQSYQTGLIGIVRDKDLEKNYALLSKVCQSLHRTSANTASEPLWKIAFAIAEQLSFSNDIADIATKKVLKQIDGQIRHLEEKGRDALLELPDATLLKTLLYSVATAGVVTESIVELRNSYQLEKALAESEAAPVAESFAVQKLVQSIVDSARQEMLVIAEFDLADMHDAVTRLQHTFRVLFISDLLPHLQSIEKSIQQVIDEGDDISAHAESILGQLESIETFLAALLDKKLQVDFADIAGKYQQYISRRREDQEKIRECITEYLAANCEISLILPLPDLLDRQVELLAVSPLKRLVPVMTAAYDYITSHLLSGDAARLPVVVLEALAEAISSVEYYLECMTADTAENLQAIIERAEASIAKLNAPLHESSDVIQPEAIVHNEAVYDDFSDIPAAFVEEDGFGDVPVLATADIQDDVQESEPVVIAAQENAGLPDTDDMIVFDPGEDADEEILEIFIEEAREVLDHIKEYLPQLEADYNNIDALLEIRRSFHTLKGSGRMVNAMHIGDFAWSIERMLNSVRDGIAKLTDNAIAILHLAVDCVPLLIDGMEQRSGVSKRYIQNVIDRADAEWEGKVIPVAATPVDEGQDLYISDDEIIETPALAEVIEHDAGDDEEISIPVATEEPVDEELLSIFFVEAESHIKVLSDYLANIDPGYEDVTVTVELQRALHTLKGSSHMAGIDCIAILATPLEAFVKDLSNFQTNVDVEILTMLVRAQELLEKQMSRLQKGDMSLVEGVESFVEELKLTHASRIEMHREEADLDEGFADKYTALLSEALDSLTHAGDLIKQWQLEGIDDNKRADLIHYIYRLSGTAGEAKYHEIKDLSEALGDYYSKAIQLLPDFDEQFFVLANKAHDELDDMMNIIAAHQLVDPATDLIEELQQGIQPPDDAIAVTQDRQAHDNTGFPDISTALLAELREQLLVADADTLEIFTEEASELLESLDILVHDWLSSHKNRSALGEIKRLIHTLKGGARLTYIKVLADLTHAYEACIETAESNDAYDETFFEKVASYQHQLGYFIDHIVSGAYKSEAGSNSALEPVEFALDETDADPLLIAAGEDILPEEETWPDTSDADIGDESILVAGADEQLTAPEESLDDIPQALVIDDDAFDIELAENTQDQDEASVPVAPAPASDNAFALLAVQYGNADQETLEIFLEEALELDTELDEIVNQWMNDQSAHYHADGMKRILHTLKGGARLAELSVLGDLTHHYESMIETAEARKAFDSAFFASLQTYQDQLHHMVEFVAGGAKVENIPALPDTGLIMEAPDMAWQTEEPAFVEQEPASFVVAETGPALSPDVPADNTRDISGTLDPTIVLLAEQYHKADQDTLVIFLEEALELDASLEDIVSQWLGAHDEVHHADAMKRILHTLKGGARLAELSVLGDLTHDFESIIEVAEARKAFGKEFFDNIQAYQDQLHRMIEFIAGGAQISTASIATNEPAFVINVPDILQSLAASDDEAGVDDSVAVADSVDHELLALFAEEAKEQSEGIEECITDFLTETANKLPLEELKRLLHTLKGGARLTGMRMIGDLSHDFETFIINSERENKTGAADFVAQMQVYHDKITRHIAGIDNILANSVQQQKQPESNVIPIRPGITPVANVNAMLVSQAAIDATRAFIENFNKDQQRSNREPVKITPDLLENLINLAGEGSIGRSRIEEQMNELIISQVEMDTTVDRLHGQLRRLEIETEAQIVFRQEQVVSEGQEQFDPLEMDRYTHMQQLSKSLIESASDLDDISVTFTNKMRDMETLLVQQARINTELQEGLMRCQMVPFSRMVPRLRRIVRQVAQELGKKVEFDVENAEGELDRTILERMVAPLEHMLRNAVDHGIEMPDVRVAAGKPQQGSIVLVLSREGGEIVLHLKDDGAGVNIAAVRKKAIERGLMTEDATLSDHELSQFILHAGFSTAQTVTQISGRGVGMDVVHSEIKQMGGSLDINSVQGKGSIFTVRLPFTVSVNRALMVVVGTDTYAIPLNTIEGIVRVSPYELEAYYQPDAPMFEYAGQSYHLRYMGSLLHRGHRAKLEGLTTPLPVVLIRSSEYTVAVQVDKLLGSREVVVKSLGPQFGMVGGLSGATVLGDGSVVIILDMLSLIRTDFALGLSQSATGRTEDYLPEPVRKTTTVMVVDDSVTVRKVTSRLLERFGMNVILAKDGLDALTQLQEIVDLPDVMLLDIEMPRMDGFEVVSRVRHDTRLQHIPITMITSRTGDKHRERAIALGANRYLGKPFQERELLQTISELTGAEIQQA